MKIIKPSFEILDKVDGIEMLKKIEIAGRTCYKSEDKITEDSCKKFVKSVIDNGHHSVLEHEKISVKVICDRGVTHEIVRHRLASYSQESTRYCNYSKDKFGGELTFIEPCFWNSGQEPDNSKRRLWFELLNRVEKSYLELIELGASPQEARSVLPNSLKTEIVMTMNLREWRHFFTLRTSPKAHPQMQEIAKMMLAKFKELIPVMFDDI